MTRFVIIISAISLLSGCALEPEGDPPPRSRADGGGDGDLGAQTDDAFPASEASGNGSEGVRAGTTPGDPDGFAGTCLDGMDNDDVGGLDCDDPACALIPSCTVGSGNLCTVIDDASLEISGCAELPATSTCLGGAATPFGSPGPWVADGALLPGGADSDSGILYTNDVALRSHRLILTMSFRAPVCADGDPCIDTAAVGVTGQSLSELDGGARVRARVALRYSGAREEVTLLLAGTTAGRWAFEELAPAWSLILRPDGLIDVLNEGVSMLDDALMPYAPIDGARVIIFGRNMNRSYPAPGGASVTRLDVQTSACDIPDAWEDRTDVEMTLRGGAGFDVGEPAEVTAAFGGAETARRWIVYRDPGDARQSRFMAAAESSGGPSSYILGHDLETPILEASEPYDLGGIADPELFWDGMLWHLWYTATDLDGTRTIAHASGALLDSLMKDAEPVIDTTGYSDLFAVEMPSHTRSESNVDVLIVRAARDNGAHQLVAFVEIEGVWARLTGSALDAQTLRGDDPVGARFDADEIAHPSIVRVGGSYHIYYAGRRGTRWGIGLLATDELRFVRDVTADSALLAGSGSGFDALSTLEPDVLVEDGLVSLFYIGSDGADRGLGRVARSTGGSL